MNSNYNLNQWHEDLWTVDTPFKFFGISFGNRMTVMRVGVDLILHSPVAYSEALANEISALGEVRYLVSPNNFHHLHINGWRDTFPDAKVIGPQSQSKIKLDDSLTPELIGTLEQQCLEQIKIIEIQGMPKLNEYVFIHEPSQTLILTDLAFNIYEPLNVISRFTFKAYGVYQTFGPTRLIHMLIKEPQAFQQSLEEINQTNFDRIIISHGKVIESGGKDIFNQAFAQYLGEELAV